MKKAFPYILFFLILGCQSSIEKGQIQGNWYRFESPNGFTAIEFKENGSFTANSTLYSDKGQWYIDGNQILLKDTIGGNHVSLKFRLLEEKEMVIEKKGDEDWGIELTMAPDFVKFFEDLNNIELRDDLSFGTSLEAWQNSFNIYLVSEDDGVLIQLDKKWENQTYNMALKDYVQSLPPDVQEKIKIFLFADINIPDKTMDSIVVEMKNRIVRDIYIVYDTNIPNYSFEGIYWKTKRTTSNKIISSQ